MLYHLSNAAKEVEQAQTETNPYPLSMTEWLSDIQILSLFIPGIFFAWELSITWSVDVYKTLLHSDFLENKDYFWYFF